ncbi:MAG: hypothetical protein IPK01_02570 [Acidobacteria bacterium]|nr:hypothetical protein [Acidobacteriota bacterium]
MTNKTKIYVAVAALALVTLGIIGGQAWSEHKIGKLEAAVEAAKQQAEERESIALAAEQKAAEYKSKIEYLEQQIAESKTRAMRQDEKIKTQNTNTTRARRDVERARSVRSIDTNADELCVKLAELGHPCG